jgi:alpha-amylase/alpha-mannosidase (GH57 family)
LSDINKEVVDTIPSKQYTGNLTSIYFKLRNGASYEVLPKMKYSEELYKELRYNFKLGLIADSSIKCIRYIRKGEIVEECGCSKAP